MLVSPLRSFVILVKFFGLSFLEHLEKGLAWWIHKISPS